MRFKPGFLTVLSEQAIDPATKIAAEQPDERPHTDGDQHGNHADEQRDLPAPHGAANTSRPTVPD